MELTQIHMQLFPKRNSSILMIGEFVFDDVFVVKDVRLCRTNYGNYFLLFPESESNRFAHPIEKYFYQYLLSESMREYQRKMSILGRTEDGEKDC